jgi:hypothetical protein
MAYTERYVTQAASGGGDGSIGDPWTLSEAFSNAVAGDRVNVQSDSAYSIGATSITGTGTASQHIIFRGYNSTIGDLDTVGRDTPANGSGLITTNMPAVTLTGRLDPNAYTIFQNFNFSGALASAIFGDGLTNSVLMYQCAFLNTQNSAAARAVQFDNYSIAIMCDFECSGADHHDVFDCDEDTRVFACKFTGVVTTSGHSLCNIRSGTIVGSLFYDGPAHIRYDVQGGGLTCINNTHYNSSQIIDFDFNAADANRLPLFINCHMTDSTEGFTHEYTVANNAIYEVFNRYRDITTLRTNVGDGLQVGLVETDTGGAETDYTDAGSDDFSLISSAPGEDAGISVG